MDIRPVTKKEYILYGATENTIGKIVPYLHRLNIYGDVLYLCDGDSTKWGGKIAEWTIYSKEKIKENPNAIVIILAQSLGTIVRGLRASGINNKVVTYPWFRWTFIDKELTDENLLKYEAYMKEIKEELFSIYANDDGYTMRILDQIIRQRCMREYQLLEDIEYLDEFHSVHSYFYDMELAPKGEVTFIDGGAYDGDSIESTYKIYGERMKKIYAFEMVQENAEMCKEKMKTMNLQDICTVYVAGMSDKDGKCYLSEEIDGGMGYKISEVETEAFVEVRRIDSLNLRVVGDAMLKMDIEGSELDALKGAETFIKNHHPYMAICVYHKVEDIYNIPAFIKSVRSDYKFYIRGGGHIECYAVPIK